MPRGVASSGQVWREQWLSAAAVLRALEMIASGELPCLHCGEVHQWKKTRLGKPTDKAISGTWVAADGHPYARPDPSAFARRVLEGDR
jgi:hypothetical protein